METLELQTNLIREILNINDVSFLENLQKIISSHELIHQLSDFEENFINESISEIEDGNFISNKEVFSDLRTWLNEK